MSKAAVEDALAHFSQRSTFAKEQGEEFIFGTGSQSNEVCRRKLVFHSRKGQGCGSGGIGIRLSCQVLKFHYNYDKGPLKHLLTRSIFDSCE